MLDVARSRHHFANDPNLLPSYHPPMRSIPLFAVLCATMLVAGCTNPRDQANMIAALNDAANEMAGLKNDLGALQAQVDSLQDVVAKHDTTITRVASFNNIPIAK
jgi:outer membrane murein-binding lipoprotein Lpp